MPDGVIIPGGPSFSGSPQPPDVPCDPTGDGWRGPPGPQGPPGAIGGLTGGTLTGPLNYTATGATANRSLQSRMGEMLSATDFGIICDGVTDQGAALNAALASTPGGTTLFVPGSIYTTQTIVVDAGRRLIMGAQNRVRVDANTIVDSCQIIGSNTLSPVVSLQHNLSRVVNLAITRNGTPPAGSIGLAIPNGNQTWIVGCDIYNHDIGVQCGTPASIGVGCCTTTFEQSTIWNCLTDYVYLINAPETTFINTRWGCNGTHDPPCVSLVHFDGDNNTTSGAATTNTISFIRCQFNPTASVRQYVVRWTSYASPDGIFRFADCYMSGATGGVANFYIDPACQVVRDVSIHHCAIQTYNGTSPLISDAGKRLLGLTVNTNSIAGNLSLSGVSANITNNYFKGGVTLTLDAMNTGSCVGNNVANLALTGVFVNDFAVVGNSTSNFTSTATGSSLSVVQPEAPYGKQLALGSVGAAGRVDFIRGTDGALGDAWVGISGAAGGQVTELNNSGGSAIVRLNAADPNGTVLFMVNTAEVARADAHGLGISKVTAAAVAPGAGFAKLAFVAGTTAGTGKLVAYCGTSTTPVTIVDNIGAGF